MQKRRVCWYHRSSIFCFLFIVSFKAFYILRERPLPNVSCILSSIMFNFNIILFVSTLLVDQIMQNLASRSLQDEVMKKVKCLTPIAEELGVSLPQLAIAWCASNPNVSSVITGATKEAQVSIRLYSLMSFFCYKTLSNCLCYKCIWNLSI